MPRQTAIASIASFLLVSTTAVVSIWLVRPPPTVGESAPATVFSSARAMQHVRIIAERPHPVGSDEHDRVRDYLVRVLGDLGAEPKVQQSESWNVWTNQPLTLQNIVGRINGTEPGTAVLLMCHYDSVPAGPGAGDDAAGVAAVLESVRALRAGSPLRNDVIVLITDGEEGGLLGASAFVDEHPWIHDVGFVLNFDARGNGGPAMLVETSDGNGRLIAEFARAAPHPMATSFAVDVYKLLPNDGDFTILRAAGKQGLYFAFFKGLRFYHSDQDTVENLDERTVQHFGSYCLSLARHFGNLKLDDLQGPDAVFFNLIGTILVTYPLSWVMPLTVGITILFLLVYALGLKRRKLTLAGIGGGLLTFLLCLVAAPAVVTGLWLLVRMLPHVGRSISRGDVASGDAFSIGFAAIAVAVFGAIHGWAGQKISLQNRTAGALVMWLILAVASCIVAPRGNYFFVWSLVFSLVGLAQLFAVENIDTAPLSRVLTVVVLAVPGIMLMAPSTYLIAATVGTSLCGIPAASTVATLGLLMPLVDWWLAPRRWLAPMLAAFVGFGAIAVGVLTV